MAGSFNFRRASRCWTIRRSARCSERYWTAGRAKRRRPHAAFKLAWDLIGSDHASRATSYEKFFVGPAFAVRNYNFINAPWDELHQIAEDFMATYGYEGTAAPRTVTDLRASRSATRKN